MRPLHSPEGGCAMLGCDGAWCWIGRADRLGLILGSEDWAAASPGHTTPGSLTGGGGFSDLVCCAEAAMTLLTRMGQASQSTQSNDLGRSDPLMMLSILRSRCCL